MSDDRVLIITGASSGIGRATARVLAGRRRLVLAGRRAEPLEELARELGGPERALAVPADVSEWEQNQALATAALGHFGEFHEVFANAGFGATRGFLEETPEHWRSMVLTNVLGPALTIRGRCPTCWSAGGATIWVTSSIAGRRVLPGSLYSATKFAATAIGEALRQELRGRDDGRLIKTTLIEPGMTDTDFFDQRPGDSALGDDDIARTVAFALDQPDGVDVNEILIRPVSQAT